MKKVLLVLAVAGVMVACNNKKKGDKKEGDTTTTTTTNTTNGDNNTTTTTTTTTPSDVPKFADPEVQAFVNDYTAFVNSYLGAYQAKNMTKVTELAGKYQEWAGKTSSIGMKLASNPDDAKKFSDYMTAMGQKWADAAKAMTPKM